MQQNNPLHNFDFNNVSDLHKIIVGLVLAMRANYSIEVLSNFKELDNTFVKLANLTEEEFNTTLDKLNFVDFQTGEAGEAALELTNNILTKGV